MYDKNRQSDLNGIGVNAGDSKLMLLGINLLLLGKVNAARHKLTAARESINLLLLLKVNAARHNLQLLVNVNAVKTVNEEVQLQALMDGKKIIITEATIRKDLQLEDAEDEAVNEEPSMQLNELMDFCNQLQQIVLDMENTSLKLRVKKLEKRGGSRTHKLKRLYNVGRSARVVSSKEASLGDQEDASKQGRKINDIDKDAKITLVDET
ncbi:hypothetical protein Tco_1356012 [Tanacetum coccineum]